MSKLRSPNYPAVSLPDAIDLVRKLWDKDKRTIIAQDVAARHMGYSSLNGPARTKLSALRKYGLVDDIKDGVCVSDAAMELLHHGSDTSEYKNALRRAALAPDIFKDLYDMHKHASDDSLKSHLVVKRGFSEDGAKRLIEAFRQTIAVANLDGDNYTPIEEGAASNSKKDETHTKENSDGALPPKSGMNSYTCTLDSGEMVLQWPKAISEEDLDLVEVWIEAMKKKIQRSVGNDESK